MSGARNSPDIALGTLLADEAGIPRVLSPKTVGLRSRSNDRRRLEALLADLQSVTKLRRSVLKRRSTAKEQSAQMRILHHHLLQRIQSLVRMLKEKLPAEQDHAPDQGPEGWDECLIDIKDCVVESGKTGKEFDDEQKRLIDLEWDMLDIEMDLYAQFDSRDTIDSDKRHKISEHDAGLAADIAADVAQLLPSTAQSTREPSRLGSNQDLSYNGYAGVSSVALLSSSSGDMHGAQSRRSTHEKQPWEDFDGLGVLPFEVLSGPPHNAPQDVAEDILGDGSQFWDEDVENLIEEARKEISGDPLEVKSRFERELQMLPRWLLYGTPWSGEMIGNLAQERLSVTTPATFRALLWYTLATVCSGLPASASLTPLKDLRSFTDIKDLLVGTWMWDPSSRDDIPRKHAHADPAEPPTNTHITSDEKKIARLSGGQTLESPSLHANAPPTPDPQQFGEHEGSQHSALVPSRQKPPSEPVLGIRRGYEVAPEQIERHYRSTSLP